MRVYIQDPADPQAPLLHERILGVCEGAARGAGAFAFVTRDGVELLLRDEVFQSFATRGRFDLIVGVDEITNVRALDALEEACQALPGLQVRVFFHNLAGATFHPKMCWFRHRSRGFVVVGSGNLTLRGLRGNWEAFSVAALDRSLANNLEAQWARWVNLHTGWLRPLNDPAVRARAALNVPQRRRPPAPEAGAEGRVEAAGELAVEPGFSRPVLVAEIPRAANRWNQANFDLDTFRNFFGARAEAALRVVFQHVDASGALVTLERRPSVAVRSRNFRFELEAAAGLDYPTTGRPIAVFAQVAPRTFRYRLVMPGDGDYPLLSGFLDREAGRPPNRMRRVRTNSEVLQRVWPQSPLWRTPLEVQD